ncbi:MAG: hypothetical protein JXR41_04715 [Bacteroidales bacterium]|nr:hypothetical protein [Bacteroidales bacterium]MBN2762373.1 hypothetical protein [Bacteroidales bacterium]
MRNVFKILFVLAFSLILFSCEKWYETADVSHESYLPEFTLVGGDFISITRQDSGEFDDPGVEARVNGTLVNVYYLYNYVDITESGVYIVLYYAENPEGFSKTAERIVAVTEEDVSGNDLSGTYTGTNWDPVEVTVIKVNEKGLYKMDDVMGFPGFPMPGRFVDMGDGDLVLLHGEGYFGEYDASDGQYTQRTLSWNVNLLTDPYKGYVIPVTWRKVE